MKLPVAGTASYSYCILKAWADKIRQCSAIIGIKFLNQKQLYINTGSLFIFLPERLLRKHFSLPLQRQIGTASSC